MLRRRSRIFVKDAGFRVCFRPLRIFASNGDCASTWRLIFQLRHIEEKKLCVVVIVKHVNIDVNRRELLQAVSRVKYIPFL